MSGRPAASYRGARRNAARKAKIAQADLHHGSDYTPYEGIEITGWPVATMVRGKFVVRDGKLTGAKGAGAYIPREKSPRAAPAGRIPEV